MGWFDQERDKSGPSCPKERNIAEFLFGNTSDRDGPISLQFFAYFSFFIVCSIKQFFCFWLSVCKFSNKRIGAFQRKNVKFFGKFFKNS
jgi:hypothetical protein